MNLLAEEKIVWTVPASAYARKLLRELRAIPEGSKLRRRDEILKELPQLTQYRLTLVSVTMREEGQRDALLAEVREWFEQTYGIGVTDYNKWFLDKYIRNVETDVEYAAGEKLTREQAVDIFGTLRDIANWASIMVCLRLVEKRLVPMQDADDSDVPWQEVDMPVEWRKFDTFLDVFPRTLFTQAAEICNDINPGVWLTQMDDDSKNVGGVSVRG